MDNQANAETLTSTIANHARWLAGTGGACANLRKASLPEVDLRRADLRGACLSEADLRGANLKCADLWKSDLSNAYLTGADLSFADLSGADLTQASLRGANLTNADLTGANLEGANLSDSNLKGTKLAGTGIGRSQYGPIGPDSDTITIISGPNGLMVQSFGVWLEVAAGTPIEDVAMEFTLRSTEMCVHEWTDRYESEERALAELEAARHLVTIGTRRARGDQERNRRI